MNNELYSTNRGKHSSSKLGIAFLFILAGTFLLGLNFGFIPAIYKPILISWQMLLIAIGLLELCKKHFSGGFILIAIGSIFIYPVIARAFPDHFAEIDLNIKQWWPLILIIVGITLILGKSASGKRCRKHFSDNNQTTYNQDNANQIDENVLFSGTEHIILSQEFEGGEANVMFGEIKLDLRKANLSPNLNSLKAACMFGSISIYVPSDWDIKVKKSVLFGNIEDKRTVSADQSFNENPVLNIKCECLFGNIEIKN